MDLSLLEHFLEILRLGSLTEAARVFGVSQSGLTRQIQRLEQETGVPLFTRTRAGLRPTPAGERYAEFAREVLALHHRLLADVRGEVTLLSGELRLVASTTPSEFLVPALVADFTARHPEVRPVIHTADSEGVIDDLLAGRRDVGFVGAHLPKPGLRFEPAATDEVVLAVPAGHPLARQSVVPLAALVGQCFIEREGGSGTSFSVRRALAENGLELPPHRVGMTLSTTQAIVAAVRDGYGIGFVSSLALTDVAGGRAVAVRLAELSIRRSIYLVWEERRAMSEVAGAFVDFCRQRQATGAATTGAG